MEAPWYFPTPDHGAEDQDRLICSRVGSWSVGVDGVDSLSVLRGVESAEVVFEDLFYPLSCTGWLGFTYVPLDRDWVGTGRGTTSGRSRGGVEGG